ncbi:MAG TPA: ATP-dependent zinc metalloprotease FtsH [Candidatus Methylomirabilis sp.]|nr:ATP-dependent zinc metalloprotease FtsH [Candidatus Methylomirabilis sp.]
MRNSYKTIGLWVILIALFVCFYNIFSRQTEEVQEPTFTQLLTKIDEKKVRLVSVKGNTYSGTFEDTKDKFRTTGPAADATMLKQLRDAGVDVKYEKEEQNSLWLTILGQWMPVVFLFVFFVLFMRQLQGTGGKAMTFGKSKAKLLSESHNKVTFADVAGIDECKEELEEIIAFLKDPKKFTKLGGRIPKGVLMMGPPGTGKTLLAKAVAGEAGRPFFSMSGSDFVEMFVGVGASRVRDLFEQGKAHAPCIIFIDEIDAVGRHRGAGLGGGHDEREQTLNQLLVEMDGFESNDGVILLAATNRPDILDPALLRPGRFDRQIVVDMPDVKGREQILRVHTRKIPLAQSVDLEPIAKGTPGLSGAELSNIVNEAALLAARRNKQAVDMADLEDAKDKVMLGLERKSMVLTEEERKLTAYHEAGHAIVGLTVPGIDPIHKVTIVPRGRALGITFFLPEKDRRNVTRQWLTGQLAMSYGGRVAEEEVFGADKVTTGAYSDIQQATEMARRMVTQFGMSDVVGPIAVGDREAEIFLGREVVQRREVSERTAELVDAEVRRLLGEAYERARHILAERRDSLDRLAQALLEHETLDREEVELVMAGKPLPPATPPAPPPLPAEARKPATQPLRGPVLGNPPPEPAGA